VHSSAGAMAAAKRKKMSLGALTALRMILFSSALSCLWAAGLLVHFSAWTHAALALSLYGLTGGHHTLYLCWHTLPRDARGAFRYIRLLALVYLYQRRNVTVPRAFAGVAKRYPERDALVMGDKRWTFAQLEAYSARVANVLLAEGYRPGDCVALDMYNCPEYVGIWLGCAKIGVVPALINTNLRGQSFLQSLKEVSAKGCIFGTDILAELGEAAFAYPGIRLYRSGRVENGFKCPSEVADFDTYVAAASESPVPAEVEEKLKFTDKLLYIYTSGTTGLPKAAVIKHSRFYIYCAGMYYLNNMGNIKGPRFYNPLPLYHSAGGVVGIGIMLVFGVSVVLRKKFSVRNFWKDCCQYECNGAQYIGEICRYLLSAPETPEEKMHKLEFMFGNGLRPQLWNQFVRRFGVARIGEFYGATEGNSNVRESLNYLSLRSSCAKTLTRMAFSSRSASIDSSPVVSRALSLVVRVRQKRV